MIRRIRSVSLLAIIITMIASVTALAQRKMPTADQLLSVNGAQGTEFYLAVPQNDGYPFESASTLEFYIATSYDSVRIEVSNAETGDLRRYLLMANKVLNVSTRNNRANAAWQIPWEASEQVVPKAVIIKATKPISVYCLHAKQVSSDGYLALPTSVWGKRYIVTSYYDFREVFTWAAGFCIIARENGTEVNIRLRGSTDGFAKTKLGKKLNDGQIQSIVMQAGDCYMVMGDGQTRGAFDMTGTEVTSNKNIGMIGFHSRTALPNAIPLEGRDHLIEMTPPVSAWGKTYITLEYSRKFTGTGRGDFFRVIAAEDGTRWQLKYYDKDKKTLLGQDGGLLNAGGFRDLYQAAARSVLPYGVTVWTANKPIYVVQYSTSASWDGDNLNDPFMCNVTPREQFLTGTLFQTPDLPSNFTRHLLNLVVQVTDTTTAVEDLKSLTIDDVPVWSHPKSSQPALLSNKIPGFNDLYFCTIEFGNEARPHLITGNGKVKFGGYIYGFGNFDSYGWPAAAAFRDASVIDTMRPVLKETNICGDYSYEATELRNIPDPPRTPPGDSDQVETGISTIELLPGSDNYEIELITDPSGDFPRDGAYTKYNFEVNVIDKSRDAVAYLRVIDYADNISLDTCYYFADKLSFNPTPMDFGRIRLGTKATRTVTIKNDAPGPVKVKELKFKTNAFKIVNGAIPPEITLAPGATHAVDVEYDGSVETTDPNTDWDKDTLYVTTECSELKVPHQGMATMPRISVEDWDAGTLEVNQEACKGGGLTIRNFANGKAGTEPLIITAIPGVSAPFSISNPTTPPLPITIPPGGSVSVREVCFKSANVGTFEKDYTLNNNGAEGDSITKWKGAVTQAGPFIRGHDFGLLRENSRKMFVSGTPVQASDGIVYNSGTGALTLTGVRFVGGNEYWPAGSNEGNYVFKIGQMFLNGTAVTTATLPGVTDSKPSAIVAFEIFFRPNAQTPFSAPIEAVFTDADAKAESLVEGEGWLPQIATTGVQLSCAETPERQGVDRDITLRNAGTMPLTLSRVAFAAGTDAAFQWVTAPTTPITVAPNGGSVTFPVRFTRPAGSGAGFSLTVEFTHDAVRGNGNDTNITPQRATERIVVGGCSAPDIQVSDIDFGRNLANCDTPEGEFTITNTGGGSKALEVRSMQPVGADAAAFTIIGIRTPTGATLDPNAATTFPLLIGAQETYRVRVRFTPTEPNTPPYNDRSYQARFHIRNYESGDTVELKQDVFANVRGIGYVVPFTFSLENDLNNDESREPGKPVDFRIVATSPDWASTKVTTATLDVIVATAALSYTPGSISKGAELNAQGWTVSEPTITTLDQTRTTWRFVASGTNPLTKDGIMFSFRTQLLLAAEFDSKQTLAVDLGRGCLAPTTQGDSTMIFNCAITKRVITLSGFRSTIEAPVPNPVTGGSVRLDFEVGIDAGTVIDLINTNGQVVRTLVNGRMEAGAYTMEFPTSGLSNGSYLIRMRSAEFAKAVPVVIAD